MPLSLMIERVRKPVLFDVGQNEPEDRESATCQVAGRASAAPVAAMGWKDLIRVQIVMKRDSNLLQVVCALASTCGFSCLLYCRKKQGDENAYDGNDDK